jgi:hypothetical protein
MGHPIEFEGPIGGEKADLMNLLLDVHCRRSGEPHELLCRTFGIEIERSSRSGGVAPYLIVQFALHVFMRCFVIGMDQVGLCTIEAARFELLMYRFVIFGESSFMTTIV